MNRSINTNKKIITRSRSFPLTRDSSNDEELEDAIFIASRHLSSNFLDESFRNTTIEDTDEPSFLVQNVSSTESDEFQDNSNRDFKTTNKVNINNKAKNAQEIFEGLSKFMNDLNSENKLKGLKLLSELKGLYNEQLQHFGDSGLSSNRVTCNLPSNNQSTNKVAGSTNLSINHELNKLSFLQTPKSFILKNTFGQQLTPIEKGPLKAVIPVEKMLVKSTDKNTSNKKITPNKSGQETQKKHLTPTDDSRLKPIAQSTPNLLPENKFIKNRTSLKTTSNIKIIPPKGTKLSYHESNSTKSQEDSINISKAQKPLSSSTSEAKCLKIAVPVVKKNSKDLTSGRKMRYSLDSKKHSNTSDNLLEHKSSPSIFKGNSLSSNTAKSKK